jgi:corrinoid protein of di/trimethylamine methyltransferase
MQLNELLASLADAVIEGDPDRATELVEQGLAANHDPLAMIEDGLRPGMDVIGERFAEAECFIPDLVMSGKAMQAAIAVLDPALKAGRQERSVLGKVVIGTVRGDIHAIGKMLVGTLLSAEGFEVHDLGVDVPEEKFVEAVRDTGANLVGLSALLTTTMRNQRGVIEALAEAGLRDRVKVMIGGAPTSPEWAEQIEADAHAENATDAARIARSLVAAE